ncbi:MAG TPA: division/cell wall cluster transcriptional repressor MraZ [Thermodesulfobacteriota bacterium]|nr:division/cell wall cluster transcriptional repressor MraZ [Thermodesulfobacteriota bacterium]
MFRSRYAHTIDSKGRLSIPARFREILAERYDDRLVLTNFDRCLVAYPYAEWQAIEEKLASLSIVSPEVTAFTRFFISGATECEIDKLGRILIPQVLREYAKLEKDVIIAGQLKKFEIWARPLWEEELAQSRQRFGELRGALADLGL